MLYCINIPRTPSLLTHTVCQWACSTVCACLCSALLRLMELRAAGLCSRVGVKSQQPACQNQDMPANVCVCAVWGVFVSKRRMNVSVCVFEGGGRPGQLPITQHEPSPLLMWHLLATRKTGDQVCAYVCVCVCAHVGHSFCVCWCHSCEDKSITHVQLHTVNLWVL